jgi:hypothetical protein
MQLPANMDHNEFDFMEDLVLPFKEFIRRIDDTGRPRHGHEEVKEESVNDQVTHNESDEPRGFKRMRDDYDNEDIFTH